MAEEDSIWMDYNRDECPLPSFRMALGSGEGFQQRGHETAPDGGPVEVQHDKDSCSETVNTETSSTGTSATPISSTAPITETPSQSQGGTSSASPGTVTWSRDDNGLLVCHLCYYTTENLTHQRRHSRTHTGERPFSCDLCPQSFKLLHHLDYHRSTHTSEGPYVCSICRATFKSASNLKQHIPIHSEERPYKCAKYTDEGRLPSSLTAFCSGERVKEWQGLQGGHEAAPEAGAVEVQYIKDNCSETFNNATSSTGTSATLISSTALTTEIHSHSQGGTSSASLGTVTWSREDNGLLVCHLCNYSTAYLSRQKSHSRTHTGERPFSCDLCPMKFGQHTTLVGHRRSHTNERRYVCSICRATFKSGRNFNHHIRTHSEERPYKCATYADQGPLPSFLTAYGSGERVKEWQGLQGVHEAAPEAGPVQVQYNKDSCSETVNNATSSTGTSSTLITSTALTSGIPSHSQGGTSSTSLGSVTWSRDDNGLLVCHLCYYTTENLTHQRRHSRTHTGERPFSCDLCPQSFKLLHHLDYHRSTHTSEWPYACSICRATFKSASNLNQHIGIHSEERPYKCATYTYEGPLPSSLTAFGSGETVKEWQGPQGGHEAAPEAGPVEVQYNKDSCGETVNNATSSTGTSATLISSTALTTEIPSHSQGGTSSTSLGTVTWSREDKGVLVCHLCNYSTTNLNHQQYHSRTHSEERPFACDLCPQSFKMRHHLKGHMSTHTSERPYECTICQRTYKHKKDLSKHMRIHNTEGP